MTRAQLGLSNTIGFLIFIFIILIALIPVSVIIISQNTEQQNLIQNAQIERGIINQQYNEFLQYSYNGIMFTYNSVTNTICFIITNSISLPISIKYFLIFNGTDWIQLNIMNQKGSFIAEPNNLNSNLLIRGNVSIQLPSNIRPYENQSSYIAAITQYGNIIYAVPYSLATNYHIFEGSILTSFDLPYSYIKNSSVSFAYPGIIHYFNTTDANIYWNGINSYKPYEYYYNGNLYINLNGTWFNTTTIPKTSSFFDNLTASYINMNLDIPVLQLSSSTIQYGGGEVFWNESYFANENISMEFISTYTAGDLGSGGGLDFYLFINPEQWNLTSTWNSSTSFPQNHIFSSILNPLIYFPKSLSPYLVLSWSSNGWDLFIYNITNLTENNSFNPEPGDFILFTISYIPRTDEIYATALNYNTSQKSTAVFNLTGIFSPPNSNNYVFGIASFNHGLTSNWGLIYANVPALEPLFDSKLQNLFSFF